MDMHVVLIKIGYWETVDIYGPFDSQLEAKEWAREYIKSNERELRPKPISAFFTTLKNPK